MPDTVHGIKGLIIINEPDVWLVNLMTKTAQHQIDSGPTLNCRLPIFSAGNDGRSDIDVNNSIAGLEFGRELAYFKQKGAMPGPGPILEGRSTNAYTIIVGDAELVLFTSGKQERPVAVVRQQDAKREVYWYSVYEAVPFDANLFKPPEIK